MEQKELDFAQSIGIVNVSTTADTAVGYIDISPKALNIYGNVHGGLMFSLADNVAGMCARAGGHNHVTLQANMNYLKGADSGRILATAKVAHRGRTTCVLDVIITNDAHETLSKGTFTMYKV